MSETNLSKTKPALRTKGSVTGNFGAARRKGGSALNDIPANSRDTLGSFPTQDEYYYRLVDAYNQTSDQRLRGFILDQLKKMNAQLPGQRAAGNPVGSHCSLNDHFIGSHQ